jgi:hypothetical protein
LLTKLLNLPSMKYFILIASLLVASGFTPSPPASWLTENREQYTLYFDAADSAGKEAYIKNIDEGMRQVARFMNAPYRRKFSIFIHHDRSSLDRQWEHDWKQPGFKSECWMVGCGVGDKMDIMAPAQWLTDACEHDNADKSEVQRVITHELVHVYHGQVNSDSVFGEMMDLDWFVEGLATYASGQCTDKRMTEVRNAAKMDSVPSILNDFWKGKLKYGLSGSMVMYIDKFYGRETLKKLMKVHTEDQALRIMKISEGDLIKSWKQHMLSSK